MGKRKSSAKAPKKIKQRLDTQFTCLFCNHEKSINCTIDKKANIGTLNCKICGQSFQTSINSLSEPIDIYSNWIDACEAVAEEESKNSKEDFGEVGSDFEDDKKIGNGSQISKVEEDSEDEF
ncbi:hypothetical protein CANINC_001677 [Pichia inconspicua]|uniref:Transcription elongation factor 1 homolog n=1 Tax=Pichia inconspicua TaxID=52247 RepID=A0A4T0X373_9ASCO|nr:hypothetical protein CANINC_001677 [[Candida] inconspicua]